MNFSYVTCDQLKDLELSHPLVAPLFSSELRKFYASCPDIQPDFPVLFYLSEDNEIVSRFGAIPDTLTDLAGHQHRWAWTGGLSTTPEHRGRGFATELIRRASEVLKEKSILRGSVYSAAETLHIYEKLGGTVSGFASRYLLLKTVRPVLRRYLGSRFLMGFVDNFYRLTCYRWLSARFNRKIKFTQYDFEKIEIHVSRKAQNRGNNNYDLCSFNGEMSKILWKLGKTKFKHELYFIRDENDEIWGYFITRSKFEDGQRSTKYSDFRLMTLVDFGSFRGDTERLTGVVFEKCVLLFMQGGDEVLEIISSSEVMKRCAKANLLFAGGRGMSFTYNAFDRQELKCQEDMSSWHLTGFCGDAFTYK
jgi:GNAT superfamily N-acetyltransferase